MGNNTHLNSNISLLMNILLGNIQVIIFHEHDLYVVHLFIIMQRYSY